MTHRISAYALACVALFALTSCGDNDASSSDVEDLSVGTITQRDSSTMDVNGVAFATAGSTVKFREDFVSGDLLRPGMVVTVRGRIGNDRGSAALIVATDMVEGPVEQVLDVNTLVVLGQTVQVPVLSGFSTGVPPAVDAIVRIHGFVKDTGIVYATLVEQRASSTQFRVKGLVQNTNTIDQTFTIGQLTVDYGKRAPDMSDLPGGAPADGLFVQVEGDIVPITSDRLLGLSGELIATRVRLENLAVTQAVHAELQGFVIDDSTAPSEFILNNQRVQTTADTVFLGGTASEINRGTQLEAEGALDNTLVANQIVFRDDIVLESNVRSLQLSPTSVQLQGLEAVSLQTNSTTELSGNLVTGRHVRARGRELDSAANAVLASRLTVTDTESTVVLQGRVDGMLDPLISILGVSINTSSIADIGFKGVDGQTIGRTTFFAQTQTGDLVRASGRLDGTIVRWEELRLEE